jgi:hypothetical protein
MYKLLPRNELGQNSKTVQNLANSAFIPFDPANTDYQTFKKEINEGTAQLEDADGNLMTPEAAKAYVATLP